MQLTASHLPAILSLIGTPLLTLRYKLSWKGIAGFYMALLLLRQKLLVKKLMEKGSDCYTLESIGISHYVETVRFCMDYKGIQYTEQESVGIMGVMTTGRTVPRLLYGRTILGDSKDIMRFLYGSTGDEFFSPTQEALRLEKKFDKIGIHLRRWAYYHVLCSPGGYLRGLRVWGIDSKYIPIWQKTLLVAMYPLLRVFLLAILGINEKGAAKGYENLCEILQEVDEILSDGREFILGGAGPSYSDFQFAALMGPFEVNYNPGRLTTTGHELMKELPSEFQTQFADLYSKPSGRHAHHIYESFRMQVEKA
eukprot:TRINITY_DN3455_c0_g1_i1.p1 TRINITY_DN3455_c0_g1~~TRINITY_DN3455_c0_g1_i1.p1  ORF type:complete len:309 (+),score=45.89 TRINITY_DN3455_c0_g1_i1:67-993(+)